MSIKNWARAAASAALVAFLAAAPMAPAVADTTVTIDSTSTGQSVFSNAVPVTLPTGATAVTVKLPAEAAGLVSEGLTTLNYFYYNQEGTPIQGLSGYASINAETMELTVPVPAALSSHTPGVLPYCRDYPADCSTDPAATTFTGYRLTLFSIEASGTPYLPLFLTMGLASSGQSGPAEITVDMTSSSTATHVYYTMKGQVTALEHLTDKLILRAPQGYFHQGPHGTWSDVMAEANYFPVDGNVWARGLTKVSSDGDTAVVTMHPEDLAVLCSTTFEYELGLEVHGSTAAGYGAAATSISLGSPVCARSFSDVAPQTQFFPEIQWLADRKITTGYGNGIYAPLGTVNRDAMAAFMYRLAGSPAFTAPAVSPFSDVTPSTQFYKEIAWLAEQGISTGWIEPDGTRTFRPLNPISRDAMAAFLYRFSGSPAHPAPTAPAFSDVPLGSQFDDEISWLADQEISTGYPDGTFRPLESIRRDAMAAFLFRADTWRVLQ